MMIAAGPFCAACNSILCVEACQWCSHVQAALDVECLFGTIERYVLQGGTHCESGLALRAYRVPPNVRPQDVQRLAGVCAGRYPWGILVFLLAEQSCLLIRHGCVPALANPADAAAHLMRPPALAFVVLGRGRGMASLSMSRI